MTIKKMITELNLNFQLVLNLLKKLHHLSNNHLIKMQVSKMMDKKKQWDEVFIRIWIKMISMKVNSLSTLIKSHSNWTFKNTKITMISKKDNKNLFSKNCKLFLMRLKNIISIE